MTDLGLLSNPWPVAPARFKRGAHFDVKLGAHSRIIAKFCDARKQPIANGRQQTAAMSKKPVNEVIAEALKFYMGSEWNNLSLAKRSKVAEGTIRNCLAPEKRVVGSKGKAPSVKATELQMLANALGVEVADLVTDLPDEQRAAGAWRTAARTEPVPSLTEILAMLSPHIKVVPVAARDGLTKAFDAWVASYGASEYIPVLAGHLTGAFIAPAALAPRKQPRSGAA